MKRDVILELKHITKYFPGVIANNNINLKIRRGEVHTLLGENGAGKSTLMNILYGIYQADAGEIYWNSDKVSINSPRDAMELGIGMIHQHFMLIPNFTVWENIALGQDMNKSVTLPEDEIKQSIYNLGERLHLDIDPNAQVSDLALGDQQKVEILKALYRGSKLLILDEPSSVLSPQEIDDLFITIRKLQKEGCTIIFISHKLNEVMEISDRISILRKGKLIKTVNKKDCTAKILMHLMLGRELNLNLIKKQKKPGKAALELRGIKSESKSHSCGLKGIDFSVHSGQIVGIAGIRGNGQKQLSQIISGLSRPDQGKVLLNGLDVSNLNVRARNDLGLAYIPADRRGEALVLDFKLYENAVLTDYYRAPYAKNGILQYNNMLQTSQNYIDEFKIKAPSSNIRVKTLSGGNQQKLILAREILKEPDVLLIVQATWGLDVGARSFVYERLIAERDRGAAIILISSDLDELVNLSDRLLVLYQGKIIKEVDPKTTKISEIGLLMTGIKNT